MQCEKIRCIYGIAICHTLELVYNSILYDCTDIFTLIYMIYINMINGMFFNSVSIFEGGSRRFQVSV